MNMLRILPLMLLVWLPVMLLSQAEITTPVFATPMTDSCGNFTYRAQLRLPQSDFNAVGLALMPDAGYLVAANAGNGLQTASLISYMGHNGQLQRTVSYNLASMGLRTDAIINHPNGGFVMAAIRLGPGDNQQPVIVRCLASGEVAWATQLQPPINNNSILKANLLTIAGNGNIFWGVAAGNSLHYGMLEQQGSLIWSSSLLFPENVEPVSAGYYAPFQVFITLNSNENGLECGYLIGILASDGTLQNRLQYGGSSQNSRFNIKDMIVANNRALVSGVFKTQQDNGYSIFTHRCFNAQSSEFFHRRLINGLIIDVNVQTRLDYSHYMLHFSQVNSFHSGQLYYNYDDNTPLSRQKLLTSEIGGNLIGAAASPDGGSVQLLQGSDANGTFAMLIKTDSTGDLGTCRQENPDIDFLNEIKSFPQNTQILQVQAQTTQTALTINTSNTEANLTLDCFSNQCTSLPPLPECATGFNKSLNLPSGELSFWNLDITKKNELLLEMVISGRILFNNERSMENGFAILNEDGTTKYGNIFKNKLPGHGILNGYAAKKGGIFMLSLSNSNPAGSPLTFQITRYNDNYEELWNQLYTLEEKDPYREIVYKLAEDNLGNIYVAVLQQYFSNNARVRIIKLSEGGNIIWDKAYASRTGTLEDLRITVGQGKLFIAVKTWNPIGTMLMRVNTQNGTLDFANMITKENTHPWLAYGGLFHTGDKLLMAGTIISNINNTSAIVSLDLEGNLLDSRQLTVTGTIAQADFKNDKLSMLFYNSLEGKIVQTSGRLDSFNYKILNLPRIFYPRSLRLNDDGTSIYIAGLYPNGVYGSSGGLIKIPAKGGMGDCVSSDFPINTLPQPLNVAAWPMPELQTTSSQQNSQELQFLPIVIRPSKNYCFEAQGCDKIVISGDTQICDTTLTYTYTWNAGSACTKRPSFNIDAEKIKIVEQTAQQIKFQFLKSGSHMIRAELRDSCNTFKDSIEVQVTHAVPSFQKWRDTTICIGDSLRLKVPEGFEKYTWDNGSSATERVINTAGNYYVDMESGCGKVFSDSIRLTVIDPPELLTWSDTAVCKGNPIQVQAAAGFTNYQWQGPSNESSNTSLLLLDGLQGGVWTIQARINEGCYRSDTLKLKVITPATFSLGKDTSLCKGDTLHLQSPAWLMESQWQNGSRLQNLSAFLVGQYTLSGIDTTGCNVSDTINVLSVHELPIVNLGQSGHRCATNDYRLDAGEHNRYQWNNGTNSRYLPIVGAGVYYVTVKNEFGCESSDSINITNWRNPPNRFLYDTLSFCRYQTAQLTATLPFASYLWSTGASTRNLTVSIPGIYSLQVTDSFGCIGTDSILVSERTCLEGLHIPNAFTPNGDGLNDVFKAITNTPVVSFELVIYSRYGEVLFISLAPSNGWDGKFKGAQMPAGTYVWMCRYQLIDAEPVVQKGAVSLLR